MTQLLNYPCFTLVIENRSFTLQRDQWNIFHFSKSPLKRLSVQGIQPTEVHQVTIDWTDTRMYENRSYTSWVTDNHRLFLEMFSKTDSTADCSERLNFCKELRPFIIQQRMHKMHISRYYLCKQNVMGTIYARLLRALWFQLRLLAMHWHR